MKNEFVLKIYEYWHLSKVTSTGRHERMIQVKKWLIDNDMPLCEKYCQKFGKLSHKELWLNIEDAIKVY